MKNRLVAYLEHFIKAQTEIEGTAAKRMYFKNSNNLLLKFEEMDFECERKQI